MFRLNTRFVLQELLKLKVSEIEAARLLKLNPATVRKILGGGEVFLQIKTLSKLAKFFKCDCDALILEDAQ